jgi:hypothetical protein
MQLPIRTIQKTRGRFHENSRYLLYGGPIWFIWCFGANTMAIDERLATAFRSAVVRALCHPRHREWAEDAAQELVCEMLRQPGTQKLIELQRQQILAGRLSGVLAKRVRAKADSMSAYKRKSTGFEDSRQSQLGARHRGRDWSAARIDALAERAPWIVEALEAQRHGCDTWKEIANHIGIRERTFYSKLRKLRKSGTRW